MTHINVGKDRRYLAGYFRRNHQIAAKTGPAVAIETSRDNAIILINSQTDKVHLTLQLYCTAYLQNREVSHSQKWHAEPSYCRE